MKPITCLLLLGLSLKFVSPARGESVEWVRQFGTDVSDRSYGVAADKLGNVYVSVETLGSLGGPIAGAVDIALARYDAAGNLAWTRQFGTSQEESSRGISADGL